MLGCLSCEQPPVFSSQENVVLVFALLTQPRINFARPVCFRLCTPRRGARTAAGLSPGPSYTILSSRDTRSRSAAPDGTTCALRP